MKELLPGVFQIILGLPGFNPNSMNVYLLKSDDGYVIVDTGWDTPQTLQTLEKQLAEADIKFTDIKRVFITHCHIDHMGMMGKFKKSHDARTYMHENEMDLIDIRFKDGDCYIPMTNSFLRTHGVPESDLKVPEVRLPYDTHMIKPDIKLKGGEEIPVGEFTLKVINTPGHTPGHVALYEPRKRFIISGDILLPTIDTNSAIHIQHMANPLQDYLDSLQRLKELDIDLILPGHEYVFSGHRRRIEELLKNNQKKANAVLAALKDGKSKTAYDVSMILSWSPEKKSTNWESMNGWDKRFAVLQAISYLESFRCQHKVDREIRDGIFYYRLL